MRLLPALLLLTFAAPLRAEHPLQLLRSDKSLFSAPKYEETADYPSKTEGVRSLFFDSIPYQGHPTKTFAYLGIPKHQPGQKLPAILLIHGGGGTAFPDWVKLWTDRGYVAIAPDVCGSVPAHPEKSGAWQRHDPTSGPPGWDPFPHIDDPITDQWPYHALADAILATSLLQSLPDVDPNRVGVTGISWGGYLTCMLAAVDDRLKFANPVYGTGFIDQCIWAPNLDKLTPDQRTRWLATWDPKHYLPHVTCPMLWLDGTNDIAYLFDALRSSYRLPTGPRVISTIPRMPHGHPQGQLPEIIHAFADSIVNAGPPLPTITLDSPAHATYTSHDPVTRAELLYTTDTGPWPQRNWQSAPATVDAASKSLSAPLPPNTKAYFFNLTTKPDITVSTELQILP